MPTDTSTPHPMEVRCRVRSRMHKLTPAAFELLLSRRAAIFVEDVTDFSFVLGTENRLGDTVSTERFSASAHLSLTSVVMGLSIATFGVFLWEPLPNVGTLYERKDEEGRISVYTLLWPDREQPLPGFDIAEGEVRRALQMYAVLATEHEQNVRIEYLKGLMHLELKNGDVTFYRDAFSNFYRSLEWLVVQRMREGRRPSNELETYRSVLKEAGIAPEGIEEFEGLYRIRCEQVGHAQKPQRHVSRDDALKMKALADLLFNRVYGRVTADEARSRFLAALPDIKKPPAA
jgi:hypothetical protein